MKNALLAAGAAIIATFAAAPASADDKASHSHGDHAHGDHADGAHEQGAHDHGALDHGAQKSADEHAAGSAAIGDLTLSGAHARVVVPSRPAAAYLVIENVGAADRLIGVSSEAFGYAELHTHKMEGDLMRMVEVEAIDIPAGGAATLRSGGDHLMLFKMKEPLAVGDMVPLTLTFESAGDVSLNAPIRPIAESGSPEHAHGQMGHGQMGHGQTDHGEMDHGAKAADALKDAAKDAVQGVSGY
ncbi:MAG: copper chaperone PCu(A)C [Pseudomonadota bacterium]